MEEEKIADGAFYLNVKNGDFFMCFWECNRINSKDLVQNGGDWVEISRAVYELHFKL